MKHKIIYNPKIPVLKNWVNGNYKITIFQDGTKIRVLDEGQESFKPTRPESVDIKLSSYCVNNCEFCHEGCSVHGLDAKFDHKFLTSLIDMELAVSGNCMESDILKHFSSHTASQGCIPNITIDIEALINILPYYRLGEFNTDNHSPISCYVATGISIPSCGVDGAIINHFHDQEYDDGDNGDNDDDYYASNPAFSRIHGRALTEYDVKYRNQITEDLHEYLCTAENVVFHVIAGVNDVEGILKLAEYKRPILILGYKKFGRGEPYYQKNKLNIDNRIADLSLSINDIISEFPCVSFDNLALQQLVLERRISDNNSFMGNDGEFTMYIDLVEEKFAVSSTTPNDQRHDLLPTIEEMFAVVREDRKMGL